MPVNNCTHIKVTGVRCGSPALRGEQFCYFHQRMLRSVKVPDSRVHHAALLEDEEAIQVSLMEVVNGLIRGTIELKRGELILRALNTAVRNIRRVKFDLHRSEMVTQVPDYNEPSSPNESRGQDSWGDGSKPVPSGVEGTRPGGQEVPGRSAVAADPATKSPAIDPTRPKRPLGVKEVEAPKERKIAAYRVSGG
jgi:hypothetical protein